MRLKISGVTSVASTAVRVIPALILAAACSASLEGSHDMTITFIAEDFGDGAPIPRQYTCDGDDRMLQLMWSGAPAGTVEYALIFDDPDAGGFIHWVVVGIPPQKADGVRGSLPPGAKEGRNDFGGTGYRGPCPPANHTYALTLYALSAPLGLTGEITAEAVRRAAADKTLATATLRGTYGPRGQGRR
jgi:Raf kinase inhibitor-like YbhB/YbcL family protein